MMKVQSKKDSYIRIRIQKELKQKIKSKLSDEGLTMSQVIEEYLKNIIKSAA